MNVVSIRNRLGRAIDRLPLASTNPTVNEIDARLSTIGIDPEKVKQLETDPNATELEMVIAFSGTIPLDNMPSYQWSEAQALGFLKWRDEKRQKRYYKTIDGRVIRK